MCSDASHHKRNEYCVTRLKYRQGRELKAVKVYTVANESRHLLVFGVPKINILPELKQRVQRFGKLEYIRNVTAEMLEKGLELELFTEVFCIKFQQISDARKCKRYLDAKEFYGGILHISYAPENETVDELRDKLCNRHKEINQRQQANSKYKRQYEENESLNL